MEDLVKFSMDLLLMCGRSLVIARQWCLLFVFLFLFLFLLLREVTIGVANVNTLILLCYVVFATSFLFVVIWE